MDICGLVGGHLSHSWSPTIHSMLGGYDYRLFEMPECELAGFFSRREFLGVNVTIPYKIAAMELCDEVSDEARAIGCVNTVVNRGGRLFGYNTDCFGFEYTLHRFGDIPGCKAVIFGSGGASRTVRYALGRASCREIVTISRRGVDNYGNLARHRDADVIVNTTPVGMYPDTGAAIADISGFEHCRAVIDLIYNPRRTRLLSDAERLGIPCCGGLYMLAAQAKRSSDLFLGVSRPDDIICDIADAIASARTNVILIGMPGCGKTTEGRRIAAMLGRRFVDTDEEISRREGMDIPQIFEQNGEGYFRRAETALLREYCREASLVISTGGGCVTVPENRDILRQNGLVIWLQRDTGDLATDGRPLSQGDLRELYRLREPLYRSFADCSARSGDASAIDALLHKYGIYGQS